MANIPCNQSIQNCDCGTSGDGSNPLANFSSAAPDVPVFTGFSFGRVNFPPLGANWTQLGCVGVAVSQVSQEDADLQATAQAYNCVVTQYSFGGFQAPVPPPSAPVGGRAGFVFFSQPQNGGAACPDGTTFHFQSPGGLFAGASQASANAAELSYANRQAVLRRICLSTITDRVCLNTPYNQTITATAPGTSNTFTIVAGALPPGLTFNNGVISGTPTGIGIFTFSVQCQDAQGDKMTKGYTITIAGLDDELPDGTTNNAYTFSILAVGFDVPQFVADTPLPDGLSMDASGNITGTPTSAGDKTFTVTVTEPETGFNCTQTLNLHIATGFTFASFGPWQVNPLTTGTGTASGTGTGGTASGNASSGASFHSAFARVQLFPAAGGITYNGPAVNCVATYNFVQGAPPPSQGLMQFFVSSALAGNLAGYGPTQNSGSGTINFTIPDTGGLDDTITAFMQFNASGGSLATQVISNGGSITLTP